MKRVSVGLLLSTCFALLLVACGSDKSPATPTPAANSPTLVVSSFSATASGTPGDLTYAVRIDVRETGGRVAATVTGIDFSLGDGGNAHVGEEGMVTARVAAGATVQSRTINLHETSGRNASSQIFATVSYKSDEGRTFTASGNATVSSPAPVALGTIVGVVTDGATAKAVAGAAVRVTGGGVTKSSGTDSNGYYAIVGIPIGPIAIEITAAGYSTFTQSLALNGDSQLNFKLTAVTTPSPTPTPTPTPTPSPSGSTCPSSSAPSGTTAICNDGTYSQSQNRSGTCSSHNGVRCWICPGALCSGLTAFGAWTSPVDSSELAARLNISIQ